MTVTAAILLSRNSNNKIRTTHWWVAGLLDCGGFGGMGRVGRPRGWRGSALKSGVRTPGRVTASSIGSIDTILSQSRPPAVSQQHQYSPLLRSQTTLQPGVKAHATSVLGTASACSYANTIATAEHRAMHQYDAYGEAFLMAVTSIRLGVLESAMPSICCSRRGATPGTWAEDSTRGSALRWPLILWSAPTSR